MPHRPVLRRLLVPLAIAAAAAGATASPAGASDDPYASLAWQQAGEQPMGLPAALTQSRGDGVTVAVLDTGADLRHPDLAGSLWVNPGEVAGNGVDDDRNGYVDDVHGVDLVGRDGDPADDNGHGTHVAGIIGAPMDNGLGVAGVAPRASIMVVKVLSARGAGDPETVARGIAYAVAGGARIINLSIATPYGGPVLRAALDRARSAGVLVVAAAGNGSADLGARPSYPVSYGLPNVLGVAATDRDGTLDPTSSFGRGVDLAAPGGEIVSTARGGGYEVRSGTSMAAPMVSGAAALVAAAHPGARWPALRRALLAGAAPTSLPVRSGTLRADGALAAFRQASGDHSALARVTSAKGVARRAGGKPARKGGGLTRVAAVSGVVAPAEYHPSW